MIEKITNRMPNRKQIEHFNENLCQMLSSYPKVMTDIFNKLQANIKSLNALSLNNFNSFWEDFYKNPEKVLHYQQEWFKNHQEIISNIVNKLEGNNDSSLFSSTAKDNRFKDPAWNKNAYFDYLKQTYLMTNEMVQKIINYSENVDEKSKQRIMFYTRQMLDAMAPSNFIYTNPTIIREIIDSNADNLLLGLKKLHKDATESSTFQISTVDKSAFKVGENIAITPGKVIFKNHLCELILYYPKTPEVYSTPLLLVPPFINKYYIMDLQPKNSLIQFLLDNEQTTAVISWVNPDKSYAKTTFEDYANSLIEVIEFYRQYMDVKQISLASYCIGGTLTMATLSYLNKIKNNSIKNVCLITTLVDFTIPGDLGVFIDETQIKNMEEKMDALGYHDSNDMSMTFNLLRANDMIWSNIVNIYLLGKSPIAFDLLYWNADATKIPAATHSYYLRNMYLNNNLVKENMIQINGKGIDITKINMPIYCLAAKEDHIVPWEGAYKMNDYIESDIKFVLTESGHVAGVINPPSKNKYGYFTNKQDSKLIDAEKWFATADYHTGSWWEDYIKWQKKFGGKKIKALTKTKINKNALQDAPGSYIHMM